MCAINECHHVPTFQPARSVCACCVIHLVGRIEHIQLAHSNDAVTIFATMYTCAWWPSYSTCAWDSCSYRVYSHNACHSHRPYDPNFRNHDISRVMNLTNLTRWYSPSTVFNRLVCLNVMLWFSAIKLLGLDMLPNNWPFQIYFTMFLLIVFVVLVLFQVPLRVIIIMKDMLLRVFIAWCGSPVSCGFY